MLEELKKKSIIKSLPKVIVCLLCGIVLIGLGFPDMKMLMRGNVAFETLLPTEINDELIVDASIDINFGCYMEEYQEDIKWNFTYTTALYYIIPTGDKEDCRYMGIRVPASDENAMNAMAEAEYHSEYSEPLHYTGIIKKMSSENYRYFKEYFYKAGWTDAEIEQYTVPYFINVGAFTDEVIVKAYVFTALGIILVIVAFYLFIRAVSGRTLKTFKKELADSGFGELSVNSEYKDVVFFNKGDTRISEKFTFFMTGSIPHMVANEKIVWAYQKRTIHYIKYFEACSTYEVIIITYEKKTFRVSVIDEQAAQNILRYIGQVMPWVVVGCNNDLRRLYKQDYQKFLKLRFYRAERAIY